MQAGLPPVQDENTASAPSAAFWGVVASLTKAIRFGENGKRIADPIQRLPPSYGREPLLMSFGGL